jgi:hypothetical protein
LGREQFGDQLQLIGNKSNELIRYLILWLQRRTRESQYAQLNYESQAILIISS